MHIILIIWPQLHGTAHDHRGVGRNVSKGEGIEGSSYTLLFLSSHLFPNTSYRKCKKRNPPMKNRRGVSYAPGGILHSYLKQ